MPITPHVEHHFAAPEALRDVVIGMADGLTVPFALAAGLSGAVAATAQGNHLIVVAGLAEIAAGSIAMGLGGYLAARGDREHYAAERLREEREVVEKPEAEAAEVSEILQAYGLTEDESNRIVARLETKPDAYVEFMMRFELGLERPDPRRALRSALTIAGSYIAGGMIPLAPYLLMPSAERALVVSVVVTLIALAVFGYVKGRFTGASAVRSMGQTVLVGGLAAAAAYTLARLISG